MSEAIYHKYCVLPFPLLPKLGLKLTADSESLVSAEFVSLKEETLKSPRTRLLLRASEQVANYLSGQQLSFDLPLHFLTGTAFEKRVWDYLLTIPPGKTVTYGDIAQSLTSSAQAVGNACRKNPIALIVPCHRVVAKEGIGGYAGDTEQSQKGCLPNMAIKQLLLAHESNQ